MQSEGGHEIEKSVQRCGELALSALEVGFGQALARFAIDNALILGSELEARAAGRVRCGSE